MQWRAPKTSCGRGQWIGQRDKAQRPKAKGQRPTAHRAKNKLFCLFGFLLSPKDQKKMCTSSHTRASHYRIAHVVTTSTVAQHPMTFPSRAQALRFSLSRPPTSPLRVPRSSRIPVQRAPPTLLPLNPACLVSGSLRRGLVGAPRSHPLVVLDLSAHAALKPLGRVVR